VSAVEILVDYILGKLLLVLKKAALNTDEFLNYDVNALLNFYSNQHGRFNEQIPYSEEAFFLGDTWQHTIAHVQSLKVVCQDSWFRLSHPDNDFAQYQHAAYDRLVELGKVRGVDTGVVRLVHFDSQTQTLELQRAKYSDQAKSNLVMDWGGSKVGRHFPFGSLRNWLLPKHARYLPPFSEEVLANTVGIAVMLLFKAESGEHLPYLQKRADGLAVFPGAFHCTASGATRAPLKYAWEGATYSFADVFVDDIYDELKEEVGITRDHVKDLVPVALCREYLRGGKPQIFFAGLTDLGRTELLHARKDAIRRKEKSDIKEIERGALVPRSYAELRSFLEDPNITLETLPALHYAEQYARVRLDQSLGMSA
jgi:hypothetical protein